MFSIGIHQLVGSVRQIPLANWMRRPSATAITRTRIPPLTALLPALRLRLIEDQSVP